MGRSPCCSKVGLNRGAWTSQEDKILTDYIKANGDGKWRILPKKAGLKRCGKSCRLRWLNYLRPDIKRGNISPDEEELIIRLHKLLGNRWSLIAGRLPGRTDNEIKNYWNTNLGKKIRGYDHQNVGHAPRQLPNKPQGKQTGKELEYSHVSPTDEAASSSKIGSHVVRTKAYKCSNKIVIDPTPHSTENSGTKLIVPRPSETPSLFNGSMFGTGEKVAHDDLPEDLGMGNLCLSEFLDSEFFDFCEFNYGNDLSPTSSNQQPVIPYKETLQDWTITNYDDHQPFVASNLNPLISFLDFGSDPEWQGKHN